MGVAGPLGSIFIVIATPLLVWMVRRRRKGGASEEELTEHAEGRRKLREEFKKDDEFYQREGILSTEAFFTNSRGVEIFSKKWLPLSQPPIGLLLLCHGYGDTITYSLDAVAVRMAKAGFAVAGMDYEGHGLSQGLHVYIQRIENIVNDVIEFADMLQADPQFSSLPLFLYGESMGGAVALKLHFAQPARWQGAILLAPMCALTKEMTPPWIVIQILRLISVFAPTVPLIPVEDVLEIGFRVPEKRAIVKLNPTAYRKKPRLRSGLCLYNLTLELNTRLHEVNLPLLILHGEADRVTNPASSKLLYESAAHEDKTLCLYPDAWHGLHNAEPDDVVEKVFSDMISWLTKQASVERRRAGEVGQQNGREDGEVEFEEDRISQENDFLLAKAT